MPRRARRPLAGLAAAAAAVVAVLGTAFAGERSAGHLDRFAMHALGPVRRTADVSQGFADLGNPVPIALALLGLIIAAWRMHLLRGLVVVVVGPLLAMVTTSLVLKPIIDRTHGGGLAFPSGHTTAVTSVVLAGALVFLGRPGVTRRLRWVSGIALGVLVAAVAATLAGLGYHYATDTVGGFALALAVVSAVALAVDAVGERAARRRAGRSRLPSAREVAEGPEPGAVEDVPAPREDPTRRLTGR